MSDAAIASAPAPAKKAGRSWLVIILGALVAAAAAGGAAYYFIVARHAAPAEAGALKADKPKAPPVYVKLDPPFVANFEAKGMMRFLQVAVEIMTRDPVTAELLKQHDPRIRNDLLMLFGNQQYDSISTLAGKDRLRAAALDSVRKIIGAEGGDSAKVEQLYFTSFVMQ